MRTKPCCSWTPGVPNRGCSWRPKEWSCYCACNCSFHCFCYYWLSIQLSIVVLSDGRLPPVKYSYVRLFGFFFRCGVSRKYLTICNMVDEDVSTVSYCNFFFGLSPGTFIHLLPPGDFFYKIYCFKCAQLYHFIQVNILSHFYSHFPPLSLPLPLPEKKQQWLNESWFWWTDHVGKLCVVFSYPFPCLFPPAGLASIRQ